jgi:hypothetical protein
MSIAGPLTLLKTESLPTIVPQLIDCFAEALDHATPIHAVARRLWEALLKTGRRSVRAFLECHGTGDQGPTLTLPDGQEVARLDELESRRYVSIFGAFRLHRTAAVGAGIRSHTRRARRGR